MSSTRPMEQVNRSRVSVVEPDASLIGNAAPPGIAPLASPAPSRFEEGPFSDEFAVGNVPASRVGSTAATVPTTGAAAEAPAVAAAIPWYRFYRKPGWYKSRTFLISQGVIGVIGIVMLFVLLWPVVKAIAQHVVNVSVLNIDKAQIINPTNTSFQLSMEGVVTHTGIIPAKIAFTKPVNVSWKINGSEIPLGTITLSPLDSKHKRAAINQSTTFQITDEDAFGQFTKTMITQPNFTWHLHSDGLKVNALKFPTANGIHFDKDVTLNGINSFNGNVQLLEFQLPNDVAGGGIAFQATTGLNNTSPFDVDLGTVVFDLSYNDTFLGSGTGTNSRISPGQVNITLDGVLVPHNDSSDELASLSKLFTAYLNGDTSPVVATGRSVLLPPNNQSISWLTEGVTALSLNVPFKNPTVDGPLGPIKSITIGDMALEFNASDPWAPLTTTRSVQAFMQLPFGFGLAIAEIQNSFNISQNGTTVAGLSTPLGSSSSDIKVLGPMDTEGTINISFVDTALVVPQGSHGVFSQFTTDLTDLSQKDFQLVGHARAVANLSIGQLKFDPINFNVTSKLDGLRGLKGATVINSVDVVGGTPEAILLGINVSIHNPSNLRLSTGDLSLQLFRGTGSLGTTLLPNLTLNMGGNEVHAQGFFAANESPEGSQTLNDFVSGKDVNLGINGYDKSTNVSSLSQAFQSLALEAALPGLKTQLLAGTALKVLNSTGHDNNISHVTVDLVNPFTAGLKVTRVQSNVKSHGINLGGIDQPVTFDAAGHKTSTSPQFDFNLNLDPPSIFSVTRKLATLAGLSTDQLDGIVALGGYQYIATTDDDNAPANVSVNGSGNSTRSKRDTNLYTNFNLPDFVNKTFKQLRADVELTSLVSIGDYNTQLEYTQSDVPVQTDDSLDLLLPILAKPIVQKIVDGAALGISNVLISNPQESSFGTKLTGNITNAGPFDAKISFGTGLTISWNGQALGSIKMPEVQLVADEGAQLDITADFSVADVGHLTNFTRVLLTEESFEWEIAGENLSISALGINVPGISLTTKKVSLLGMNGLKNGVVIESFDLPSNAKEGGIALTLNTSVTNPSQVGIELSSIGFQNFFQSTHIGPASSASSFTLAPQSTISLPLVGRLIPQTDSQGLADVSTIFNAFIHGQDSNVTVIGDSAGPTGVSWLNEGIKSLHIQTVLPNRGKLDIIKSVDLNQLQLMFSTDNAYDPPTSSNDATAAFTIPFAFPIDIIALEQNITAGYKGAQFAELRIPKGPSKTDVEARVIHLTFNSTPFSVFDDQHSTFQQFLADTTLNEEETFSLSGAANTEASTAVGTLSLTDIEFSVDTTLKGLQGLNAKQTTVSSLDVNHGFSDFLLITVQTQLFNPSNLTIGTGDVSFELQFQDTTIGAALINNAIIVPGSSNYSTDVHYQPQGSAVAVGQQLLENYIQGVDSSTTIVGTTDTTPVDSLKLALSELTLHDVVIPALHQNLIAAASLTFPTDIVQTGVAQSAFTLANPFTASVNIQQVTASVTYQEIPLGAIDHQSLTFHADGHSNATSQSLPFNFNLQPEIIIELLLKRSQQTGVDLGPLPDLFQIVLNNPGVKTNINSSVETGNSTCVSGHQFDVNGAILRDLEGLEVDLGVQSSVSLDDFATDLAFNQSGVPAVTDHTALYLIGAVAPPIVQALVNQATLAFTQANITNLANDGFDLALVGSLTGTGPLDAEITFVEPVKVTWEGRDIATIALPPVCAAANEGVPDYRPNGHLSITDQDGFTSFATFLLHNPSFTWVISTDKLRVTALGTIFDNVSLTKNVTLKAFNGIPGVTISNFELPSDDPAGGIHIETDSAIPSPAQLGIDLGTVTFNAFFEDVLVGPLSGQHLVLPPQSTVVEHLSGRIVPQSDSDLDAIGVLFSRYLAGDNQTLTVKGDSVNPGSGEVTWLSTAFKTLELSVILPGQTFKIIQSITINDLELNITNQDEAFAPATSSQNTLATYKNPFGFSLQVVQSGENITLSYGGSDVATLNLPVADAVGGVSTGNVADLQLSYTNQRLTSINNGGFESFFAAVTDRSSVTFGLKGTANVVAKTTIGNVPISGIPFDVQSPLKGINKFGGTAQLSNVTITGSGGNGGNQFIKSPLTTKLGNPSNISLQTNDIALPVFYKGTQLGRASIDPFNLVPGENTIPTVFEYMPSNPNDTTALSFITEFVTTGDSIDLTIQGDSNSSPYESLGPALEGVKITTSLTGINFPNLITHVNVFITLDTLIDNLVSVNFDVANPLDSDLDIKFVQSDSGVNGEIFAHFDQAFDNFVVPAKGTANSGTFGNVLLTQGALASLAIIPLGYLDIGAAQTVQLGVGGYELPWMQIQQSHVPTTYSLSLSISEMKSTLSSISASRAGHTLASSFLLGASSAIANITSGASAILSRATEAASSVRSVISSDASEFTSKAGSAKSHLTSEAGGLLHPTPSPTAAPSPTTQPAPSHTASAQAKEEPSASPALTSSSPSPTSDAKKGGILQPLPASPSDSANSGP